MFRDQDVLVLSLITERRTVRFGVSSVVCSLFSLAKEKVDLGQAAPGEKE